ncbi:hypothetical protein HJB77_03265 [Rhizobium lentis]|uniref:hypothetical protein n=1 Tax=Rhizobium lentis TaxID=1138194 RepID=UPI001C82C2A5|nr:hypothetical protein [Rhizobium lentis]MBX5175316.1 hypothetical protein [Rhizobium lentis]
MTDKVDWDAARRQPFAEVQTPDDWPESVRPLSWHGMSLFGVDLTRGLYWDGKKVKTEISLGPAAKLLGGLIALFTFLAAAATVSMAVTDLLRFLNGN